MTPIELIKAERERQKTEEGWTTKHDDEHDDGQLSLVAAMYAVNRLHPDIGVHKVKTIFGEDVCDEPWPWDAMWDKRGKHDRKRSLIIAGALIVAELERLERRGD